MKLMIQIKTTVDEAEKFIRQLSTQGYTAHRVRDDVHFTDDATGITSIRYSVSFHEGEDGAEAFIGVRPS